MARNDAPRTRRVVAAAAATAAAGLAVVLGQPESDRAVPAGTEASTPAPPAVTSLPDTTVAAPQPAPAAQPAVGASGVALTPPARPPARPLPPLYPTPAAPVFPQPCPKSSAASGSNGRPAPAAAPKAQAGRLPATLPDRTRQVDLAPVTGKGMWLVTWADTELDVPRLVAQARAAGLSQLWVRTGGTRQGWYGTRLLEELLPAAHAVGLRVVAWDFPTLSNPVLDARRASAAIRGVFAGHRVDAFSPDIETRHEGTFNSAKRVRAYLSRIRAAAGDMPIIATVVRPTPVHLATYPYEAIVPYVDAFAPMVYWSCEEPGRLAAESVALLAAMRPVHLIGQSYDMGPEGGRRGMPSAREIWRFLDSGRRAGAMGASLYSYTQAGHEQWTALGRFPWPPAAPTP